MKISLGNSQRMRLNLQVQSLMFLSWVFLSTEKAYSSFPRLKNLELILFINTLHSTTRLKPKTFALQYLSQKSSKPSQKPVVRKLISLSFRRQFWLWQYFWSAAFIWPQTTMYLTTRTFRTLWARESQYKPAVKIIVKQSESKSREIWRARFLDMITRVVFRPVGKKKKEYIYIYIIYRK